MTTDAPEPSSPRGPVEKACRPGLRAGTRVHRARPIPSDGPTRGDGARGGRTREPKADEHIGLVLACASGEQSALRAGSPRVRGKGQGTKKCAGLEAPRTRERETGKKPRVQGNQECGRVASMRWGCILSGRAGWIWWRAARAAAAARRMRRGLGWACGSRARISMCGCIGRRRRRSTWRDARNAGMRCGSRWGMGGRVSGSLR